jgi:hypothetical protein
MVVNAQQRRRREYLMETGREEQVLAEGLIKRRYVRRPMRAVASEGQRKCRACHLPKHLEDFGVDRYQPLGRLRECKACRNARYRKLYHLRTASRK